MAAAPWIVSDELWSRIEPLLPRVERRFRYPGRKRLPDRQALQGILFVLHSACWPNRSLKPLTSRTILSSDNWASLSTSIWAWKASLCLAVRLSPGLALLKPAAFNVRLTALMRVRGPDLV